MHSSRRDREWLTRPSCGVRAKSPKVCNSCRLGNVARRAAALKDHCKRQLEERMGLARPRKGQGLVFATDTGSLLNPSNLRNRTFKRA